MQRERGEKAALLLYQKNYKVLISLFSEKVRQTFRKEILIPKGKDCE